MQAARQWWKEFIDKLKELDFESSYSDPCLLFRENEDGIVILCIYVDDILIVGSSRGIEAAKRDLASRFSVKPIGKLQEYIGFKVIRAGRERRLLFCQTDLVLRLEKDFGYELENVRKYSTPAAPRDIVMRPKDGDDLLSKEEQGK